MFIILWWTVWLLCLGYCICSKKKVWITYGNNRDKVGKVFETIILVCVFILLTANESGVDIINYRIRYEYSNSFSVGREMVYSFLNIFFNKIGIDFFNFKAILIFISGCLCVACLHKFEINIFHFLTFYMPSLFFLDTMLLRNTICMFLLLWAIGYLVDNKKIKYTIIILICCQIHTIYLFYLVLLINRTNKSMKKMLFVCFGIIIFALSLITLINDNTIPFIEFIFEWLLAEDDSRKTRYMTRGHWGFLLPLGMHVISCIMIEYGKKGMVNKNELRNKFVDIVSVINVFTFFWLPFLMMNETYWRFIRVAFYCSMLAAIIILHESSRNRNIKRNMVICLIFLTLIWFVYEVYVYSSPEIVLKPIFEDGGLFFLREG